MIGLVLTNFGGSEREVESVVGTTTRSCLLRRRVLPVSVCTRYDLGASVGRTTLAGLLVSPVCARTGVPSGNSGRGETL